MKTNLTIEQSAELIRLGVSEDAASLQMCDNAPYRVSGIRLVSVFSVGDLLAMLPETISSYHSYDFCLAWENGAWRAHYIGLDNFDKTSAELIDALFQLVVAIINSEIIEL